MRLLIVDGHAYAYRAFFAIRGMRSPAGQPVNAIFGFVKMWRKLRARLEPSHGLVVWDGGLSEERVAALPGYKAQRPELPAELGEQIDGLNEYLSAAGVPWQCDAGVEADDVIAGVARRAAQAGGDVVIASSDKDFMQLVGPGIGLVNPGDKEERVWGGAEVKARTGVEPAQVVDWLSLVGDSVDNIPGVPGVGAKTAARLLERFGSVAGMYDRLELVESERLRSALRAAEEVVRRNQELVRLREAAGSGVPLERLRLREADVARLADLYRKWGFRSLLAQVERAEPARSVEAGQATLL